jgi:hypothetical protein
VFLQRVARDIYCPNNEESRPDDDQSGGSFLHNTDGVVDAFRIIPWKMTMYAELHAIRRRRFMAQPARGVVIVPTASTMTEHIRHTVYRAYALIAQYAQQQLFSQAGAAALDYLHQRGLTDDTIREAGPGYLPPGETLELAVRLWKADKATYEAMTTKVRTKGRQMPPMTQVVLATMRLALACIALESISVVLSDEEQEGMLR